MRFSKQVALVLILLIHGTSAFASQGASIASGIRTGLDLSPSHYIAAYVEVIGGVSTDSSGKESVPVRVLQLFGVETPPGLESHSRHFRMAASSIDSRSDQPGRALGMRILVFAIPVVGSGHYGGAYAECDPPAKRLARFEELLNSELARRGREDPVASGIAQSTDL